MKQVLDINNEPAPNIPNDIQIIYNPNPIANFSTTTPVICFEDDAILEFDFLAGSPPFTVNYTINSVIGVPSLSPPPVASEEINKNPFVTVVLTNGVKAGGRAVIPFKALRSGFVSILQSSGGTLELENIQSDASEKSFCHITVEEDDDELDGDDN